MSLSIQSLINEEWGKQKKGHFQSKQKVLGQFFTPPSIARFMVNLSRPFYGIAVDPAVGDGTFINALMEESYPIVYGVDVDSEVLNKCNEIKGRNIQFIEGDSLNRSVLKIKDLEGKAHLVIGNPPFSSKFGRLITPAILKGYTLGRLSLGTKKKPRRSQALEILFLERFIQLAGRGGQISIIVPDGILANPTLQYVRDFIAKETFIKTVISLPRGSFSNTTSKAHILHLIKKRHPNLQQPFPVVLAVAEEPEDLPIIQKGIELREPCHIPFITIKAVKEIIENLTPDFYHPQHLAYQNQLDSIKCKLVPLGELLNELRTGNTVYGKERIFTKDGLRFISARTITPLGIDFTREELYIAPGSLMDITRAHVKAGDVLVVRVGVGCAGRITLVSGYGDEGVANDYIHILNTSKVEPGYLALFLESRLGQTQLNRQKHGVGTVCLSHKNIRSIKVPLPGKEIEDKFAARYLELVKSFRMNSIYLKEEHENLIRELEEALIQLKD